MVRTAGVGRRLGRGALTHVFTARHDRYIAIPIGPKTWPAMREKLLVEHGRWEEAGRHLVEALERMEGLGVAKSDFRAYGTGPESMETARKVIESNGVMWFNSIEEIMAHMHTDRIPLWGPKGVTMEQLEKVVNSTFGGNGEELRGPA